MGEITALAFVLPTELAELATLDGRVQQLLASAPPFADAEAVSYNIWLSLHELCVNIIGHAYEEASGTIQVEMKLHASPLAVEIVTVDQGPHVFDFGAWRAPDLDDPPIHGLGIFLIHQLMDVVEYTPAPGNNRWRLVKLLAAAEPAPLPAAATGGGV